MDEILACSLKTITVVDSQWRPRGEILSATLLGARLELQDAHFTLMVPLMPRCSRNPESRRCVQTVLTETDLTPGGKWSGLLLCPCHRVRGVSNFFLICCNARCILLKCQPVWRWLRHAWLVKHTSAADMNPSKMLSLVIWWRHSQAHSDLNYCKATETTTELWKKKKKPSSNSVRCLCLVEATT